MTETATAPLTGKALLQKIKNSRTYHGETAKRCGYYTVTKTNRFVQSYRFLRCITVLEFPSPEEPKTVGREPTYRVSVQKMIVSWFNIHRGNGLKAWR